MWGEGGWGDTLPAPPVSRLAGLHCAHVEGSGGGRRQNVQVQLRQAAAHPNLEASSTRCRHLRHWKGAALELLGTVQGVSSPHPCRAAKILAETQQKTVETGLTPLQSPLLPIQTIQVLFQRPVQSRECSCQIPSKNKSNSPEPGKSPPYQKLAPSLAPSHCHSYVALVLALEVMWKHADMHPPSTLETISRISAPTHSL